MTPRVRVALVVLVDGEGRLLLQHRDGEAPVAPWRWTPPGGRIEDGEAPYDAAVRELAEETGLVVGSPLVPGPLVPLVEGCAAQGDGGDVELWVWAGATCAAPGEVRCYEGEAMRFVEPGLLESLPLTRLSATVLPELVGGASYDALTSDAADAAAGRTPSQVDRPA